ncbi:hypothetical protein Nepgr_024176 [Nepenthes gracilis]|uniref:Pentatricopeptide repeat-containing protein n=1 Tax=Nepenthes gracilis TaxID=150966 RepID=A0AAD3XYJ4_NEPGR|nr:hypothetical protein Nepgr_024176 [Nepenthes gracilis]
MNLAKYGISSAARITLTKPTTVKPTINLAILESQLQKCQNVRQFNQILCQMISTGFMRDTYAGSRILMFSTGSSFVSVDYSRRIFDHVENPNGFIWNTMMRAYLQRMNSCQGVINLYKLMLDNYVVPDNYTFPISIEACALEPSSVAGKQIHGHVFKMGFDSLVYVQNTLISMYAGWGNMKSARQVFDESSVQDSVSWNSILAGYVKMGDSRESKLVYDLMPEKNIIASNSMIALLGKLGRVSEASQVFYEMLKKDFVSWSALISCYEQNEMYLEALILFKEMIADGISIDEVVVVTVLSACAHLVETEKGRLIHGLALKLGFYSYVNLQNACIHMYAACGDMVAAEKLFKSSYHLDLISWNSMISGYLKSRFVDKARALFDFMPEKDVVSWSAMISGYAKYDQFSETLKLFEEMQLGDIKPDETTLVSVISACTHLAALDQGKWLHAYIRKEGLKINPILGTTLIDMYMKCSCTENALEVFHGMEEKGVSTWNAVIVGLAMNGLADISLEVFSEMKNSGVLPNEITFVGVLSACRHKGLVDEGLQHFDSMVKQHKIEPNVKHYGCMVDLLGRAGLLKEAEELITSMPMAADVATWGALLAACKKHDDNERGERVGRKLIDLQPEHDGIHVLFSNTCASKGQWNDVREIRGKMSKHGVVKAPGCSLIESNGVVNEFMSNVPNIHI